MATTDQNTHTAVVTVGIKAPLATRRLPTMPPAADEVLIHNRWTASTPLDLHQNDGGLLVTHPQVLGDGIAGTIVQLGSDVPNLQVGDWVFGFGWREQKEKAYQEYVTIPHYLVGKIPEGMTPQEAVTLPNNLVTAFHLLTADLKLELPWPKVEGYVPEGSDAPILIWGAASSVGMYVLQVLRWYGYRNLIGTASAQHHEMLKGMGARVVVDYKDPEVVEKIKKVGGEGRGSAQGPTVPLMVDCIGSKENSMKPLAQVAEKGSRVAVLLPIIVKDSDHTSEALPVYAMDVMKEAPWADGVIGEGVRTHFYLQNALFKEKLQSEIVPELLRKGIVQPNRQRIVEGKTMLQRAQNAIDLLRQRAPRGERLVWRVADGPA